MTASRFTFFLAMNARPEWLRLARSERNRIAGDALARALDGLAVRYRHYDTESFSAVCSDIGVFEADDPRDYYFVIERLRDSDIFAVPYFDIVAVVPAIENGFAGFEDWEAAHAA